MQQHMAKSARGRPSRWTGPGGETSKPSNPAPYFVHTYFVHMTQIAKAGKSTASDGVTRRLRPPIPGPTSRAAITRLSLSPEKGKGGHTTPLPGSSSMCRGCPAYVVRMCTFTSNTYVPLPALLQTTGRSGPSRARVRSGMPPAPSAYRPPRVGKNGAIPIRTPSPPPSPIYMQ
ncbi:hypothetical protein VTG60DRAFT_4445 [Thermothelomyces hinnuleus]